MQQTLFLDVHKNKESYVTTFYRWTLEVSQMLRAVVLFRWSRVGCSEDESKAQGTFILPITLGMGGSETAQPPNDFAASSTTGQPDVEDPEDLVDKENCSEGGRHHSSDSPAEGAAGDSAELEDESESEG